MNVCRLLSSACVAAAFMLVALPVCAAVEDDFQHFVSQLKTDAKAEGISASVVERVLSTAEFLPRVIELDQSQPESVITLSQYLSERLTDARLAKGQDFYAEHRAELTRVERQYGVPAAYIVALIGVETNYGTTVGRTDIVSSLATLAFEGRRADFFKRELMALLKIIASGDAPPLPIQGSWAAASGRCQFMPTSFLKYAADGDGDGRKDIWTNWSDVFASTANYLKTEGWTPSLNWGYEVTAPATVRASVTPETEMLQSAWQKLGVLPRGPASLAADPALRLVQPEGETGQAFLASSNYFVLRHWNRSHKFAILVGRMADAFSSAPGVQP